MDKNAIQKNIIQDLGLQDLPEETKTELLAQMTESVLKRITILVLEKLSEQDRDEFEKIQASGDAEEADKFLKKKIPDYEQIIQGVIAEFKEEMKNNIETLKKDSL